MPAQAFILIAAFLASFASRGQDMTCNGGDLGKVEFERNSSKLTTIARRKLDSLIVRIKSQSNCQVLANSSSADLCDKCGALSWDRLNVIIGYCIQRGVAGKRLRSYARLKGNVDYVILRFTNSQ